MYVFVSRLKKAVDHFIVLGRIFRCLQTLVVECFLQECSVAWGFWGWVNGYMAKWLKPKKLFLREQIKSREPERK